MGLLAGLRTLAIACLASACYEPQVRDCTIKCTSEVDCTGDQVCGGQGYCVDNSAVRCSGDMPGAVVPDAGTTATLADAGTTATDAATPHPDATPPPDAAPPPPDAPTTAVVTVNVEGKGAVTLAGIGWCASSCQYTVLIGTLVNAHAFPGDDFDFEQWTTNACPDEYDPDCAVTVQAPVTLGAKFKKDKD